MNLSLFFEFFKPINVLKLRLPLSELQSLQQTIKFICVLFPPFDIGTI